MFWHGSYYNNLDPRLGDSTWRFTYDYTVIGERDISDLDDKDFVRLRRKNKIVLLMYSIVLIMFIASMSVLSQFLLFFFDDCSCFLFLRYKKYATIS